MKTLTPRTCQISHIAGASFATKVRGLFCLLENQALVVCGGARVESELDADRAMEKTSAIACRRVTLSGQMEAGGFCGPAHCGVVAARVFWCGQHSLLLRTGSFAPEV